MNMPPRHHLGDDDHGINLRRTAPGQQMLLVTPDDSNDNCEPYATLYIGTGGDICFIPEGNEDGDSVTMTVADGTFIDQVTVRRVKATGTTADSIMQIF
jgi:hypothetical protein